MTPQTKKPPARGGAGGGFQNHPEQRHFTRKAPYANSANINKNDCVIVCTGSGGWDRAKSPFWFPGKKVVLPFGTDPASYAWSVVAEHDAMITGFGDLEPVAVIAKLAGLLLAAGAVLVIYAPEHGPVTRIDAKRKEAV